MSTAGARYRAHRSMLDKAHSACPFAPQDNLCRLHKDHHVKQQTIVFDVVQVILQKDISSGVSAAALQAQVSWCHTTPSLETVGGSTLEIGAGRSGANFVCDYVARGSVGHGVPTPHLSLTLTGWLM